MGIFGVGFRKTPHRSSRPFPLLSPGFSPCLGAASSHPPASSADAVAAALDARPALLDRVVEVNVGTGAVRVTSRGSAVSMRVDAKRGIIGWLTEVAARLQRVVPPSEATPLPHHSILDLLPCHSVNIGDQTMLLTLRVLPTPVGSATPLRAVLHAVVTLRLGSNAPFSSIHIRCIHVRRVRGVGGSDAWVLRMDKELQAKEAVHDWWPMMMAAPPSGNEEAVALAFEVEGETREAVRVRWQGEMEVGVGFGGVGV